VRKKKDRGSEKPNKNWGGEEKGPTVFEETFTAFLRKKTKE